MPKKKPGRRGPQPERLKLRGTFKDAAKKLLVVKRPADGWPEARRYAKHGESEEE